jgi:hypothetical protein
MDTIVIKPKSKQSIPFLKHLLKNLSDVQSVEVVSDKKSRTAKSIEAGLKDTKDILDGKKKGKTLRQLINED